MTVVEKLPLARSADTGDAGKGRTAQRLARACARRMYDDDAASRGLGMEILSVEPDRVTIAMTIREDMVNGHGICHGGFVFCLADSAFAFACNSRNRSAVAANCTIDFIRPAAQGDRLTAAAEVRHQGKRTGICDVTVTNQHDQHVASFRGRHHYLERPVLPEEDADA